MKGALYCGVDIGSATTKAAILAPGQTPKVVGSHIRRTGIDFEKSAQSAVDRALESAGIGRQELGSVFACGYGRKNISFADESRTEIACHAKGAYFYFPQEVTVVDIGGQDNKIIKLDQNGQRVSFKMNRKCAAGTGAFLEEMALRLDVNIETFDGLARKAESETSLGSYCTVFSATEILAHIRAGISLASLVKGIFRSVIKRVKEMDIISGRVVMTGGVVEHNPYLAEMMAEETGSEVLIPPHPQLIGAIGAALLAAKGGSQ